MSAVIVLTPVVIASWPAITAAVGGVAAALGYALSTDGAGLDRTRERALASEEVTIEDAEAVAAGMQDCEPIVLERDGVRIEVRRDARGRCSVCASGRGHSKRQLRAMAEEVSGRIVQQYVYHKLLTELKEHEFELLAQERLADDSVRLQVRLGA
jgi:hypothetical protein